VYEIMDTVLEHRGIRAADAGGAAHGGHLPCSDGRQSSVPPLDISETVRALVDFFPSQLPASVYMTADIEPGLWRVLADAVSIGQVLMGLMVSAKDAMPDGGELAVTTANVAMGEESWRGIPDVRPGEWVCVTVSDTGVGMDEDTVARVLEPGRQTTKAGECCVAGLAAAQAILEQHGGWLSIYTKPGHGAVVSGYFPRCLTHYEAGPEWDQGPNAQVGERP
jgi:two-component system, cell cycle sensor histidine kinase and response regulator CckA